MAITTYDELQSAISDWLNRSDLQAAIKSFISLGEAQYRRSIRHRSMIDRAQATIDSEYSATPADWIQSVSLILETTPVTQLDYVTNEEMNRKKSANVAVGKPQCFTHIGEEIQVYPAPDSTSYTAELVYYAKIPSLSDTNTSNWLLAAHPDIYLYGSLMQSAPYLVDDQRLGVWAGLYQKAIDDLTISDQRTQGQSSVRMRAAPLQ
ncbi:MAG: hypothetical protein L7S55_08985 [Luminiphilus sp.]|nr:hypothetical protein [Luminiphilus sp.]